MLSHEYDVPAGSLWERGSRIVEMGGMVGVIGKLHPELDDGTSHVIARIAQSIAEQVPEIDHGGGTIAIRGSGGHRIVYKSLTGEWKPPGFDRARSIWKALVVDSLGVSDCEEARILAGNGPDIDWMVDMAADLEGIATTLSSSLPIQDIHVFEYDRIPILGITSGKVSIDIHQLPDTDPLAVSDHRVSICLPVCEAFCQAFIRRDGTVYVDAFSQAMLGSDRLSTTYGITHITQAIIGAQRALCTHHIYQDAPVAELADEYRHIGQPLALYIDDPFFWKQTRARMPYTTTDHRQREMTVGFMRLLTQDPTLISRHRPLFDQTHIGTRLDPDFTIDHDSDKYQEAFRSGMLQPDKSGVVLLARQLRMPVSEVITGLRVRDV